VITISNLSNKSTNRPYVFADLHMDLQTTQKTGNLRTDDNPAGNDIVIDTDEGAIYNSIRNIFLQRRYLTPGFTPFLSKYIGTPVSDMGASRINEEVDKMINLYEPRVKVRNILVGADTVHNTYNIVIRLTLLNFKQKDLTLAAIYDNNGNFSLINKS